jgi:hypothetical protein
MKSEYGGQTMDLDEENHDQLLAVIRSLLTYTAFQNGAGVELVARMEPILVKLVRARRSNLEPKQLAELLGLVESELTELQKIAQRISLPWRMEEPGKGKNET